MHVTSKKKVIEFSKIHTAATAPLLAWHKVAEKCAANSFNELKQTFGTADFVPERFTVFDVGGNKYRVVASIHYDTQKLFIRHIFTHVEYDEWTRKNRKK